MADKAPSSLETALEASLTALNLGPGESALIAAARALAAACAADPGKASLWAQYLAALSDLYEHGNTDDGLDALLSSLRDTPVNAS